LGHQILAVRIVINGCLSFLTRENNVAYFFRQICHKPKITKKVLLERTRDHHASVVQHARNHKVPPLSAEKGVGKEDQVRPQQHRIMRQNRCGVCYIRKSMEQGWTFQAVAPKYPAQEAQLPVPASLEVFLPLERERASP
jgi:hypothetical protein